MIMVMVIAVAAARIKVTVIVIVRASVWGLPCVCFTGSLCRPGPGFVTIHMTYIHIGYSVVNIVFGGN